MPRADKAPRLHRDHNRAAAPPRTQRNVPDRIFERLEKKRATGKPHVWTDAHVKAIVKYVSRRDGPTDGPLNIDFKEIDKLLEEDNTRNAQRAAAKRATEAAAARLPPRPTLEQRLAVVARPSDSVAGPSRAAEPAALPDFKKLGDNDLRGIYKHRLEAFRKRLLILFEVGFEQTPDAKEFHCFYRKLCNVLRSLDCDPTGYSHAAWLQIHYLCGQSTLISFKQVRQNVPKILHKLAELSRAGYLDVSQV